jgi:alkylation response protein AidB-like acyl-CoA dehydrogenase
LSPSTEAVAALVTAADRAPDAQAWQETFRHRFGALRESLPLHPSAHTPSATFAAAATVARSVAAQNLPLAIGLVMHLYPLCALRCVPLPWFSPARLQRSRLLHRIDHHSLILANAGSERAAGAHSPVALTRTRGGVLVDGTYDYVSLAHVADLVLFNAPLPNGSSLFCVADMRRTSVRIGESKFSGSMALSDTCSVTFVRHFVPDERFIVIPDDRAMGCMSQYQRSWFQMLLGEAYLARIQALQQRFDLPRAVEQLVSCNEMDCLQAYSRQLLDQATSPAAIASLARVTDTIKLRVSWLGQKTAEALRAHDEVAAHELTFLRRQPTSDERILRNIEALFAVQDPVPVSVGPRSKPVPSPASHTTEGQYSLQT